MLKMVVCLLTVRDCLLLVTDVRLTEYSRQFEHLDVDVLLFCPFHSVSLVREAEKKGCRKHLSGQEQL